MYACDRLRKGIIFRALELWLRTGICQAALGSLDERGDTERNGTAARMRPMGGVVVDSHVQYMKDSIPSGKHTTNYGKIHRITMFHRKNSRTLYLGKL